MSFKELRKPKDIYQQRELKDINTYRQSDLLIHSQDEDDNVTSLVPRPSKILHPTSKEFPPTLLSL